MIPVLLGAGVAIFILGGLSERVTDTNDLLPDYVEAVFLGLVFTLGSLPGRWSIVARALLPLPSFLMFLSILLGKRMPLPFGIAFVFAGCYSFAVTAWSAYLAER